MVIAGEVEKGLIDDEHAVVSRQFRHQANEISFWHQQRSRVVRRHHYRDIGLAMQRLCSKFVHVELERRRIECELDDLSFRGSIGIFIERRDWNDESIRYVSGDDLDEFRRTVSDDDPFRRLIDQITDPTGQRALRNRVIENELSPPRLAET